MNWNGKSSKAAILNGNSPRSPRLFDSFVRCGRACVSPVIHRARKFLRRNWEPAGLVLLYHRVAEERVDPWRLCVTPKNFSEHLQVLRSSAINVMPLDDFVATVTSGFRPPKTVVITFDDGYADNYSVAAPLLSCYDVPATVFVTTDHIGGAEEFWWDTLERIFLRPGELPPRLEMVVAGEPRRWELGHAARYSLNDVASSSNWRALEPGPTVRHEMHNAIWRLLFDTNRNERRNLIGDLVNWAGVPAQARQTHRTLTRDELVRIKKIGLIEIGAHTASHSPLSALSRTEQSKELKVSKASLEGILSREVAGCSYPHGRISADTPALAREAGYRYACGSLGIAIRANVDSFHLPRLGVEDWSRPVFERALQRHLSI